MRCTIPVTPFLRSVIDGMLKRGSMQVYLKGAPADMHFSFKCRTTVAKVLLSRLDSAIKKEIIERFKSNRLSELEAFREKQDIDLDLEFTQNRPEKVYLNVWDDFLDENGETYFLIEHRLPLVVSKELLEASLDSCQDFLDKNQIRYELDFVDYAKIYPGLIYTEEPHFPLLHRGYKVTLKNMKQELIEGLVKAMNNAKMNVIGIKIEAISES